MKRIPLIYWLPVLVYYAFITYLSGLSPHFAIDIYNVPNLDKIYHFVEYFFFGLVLSRDLFWTQLLRKKNTSWLKLFFVAVVVLIALDEFHQHFTPERNMDIFDALVDLLSASLGAWVFVTFIRGKNADVSTHQKFEELKSHDKRYFALFLIPMIFFIIVSMNVLNFKIPIEQRSSVLMKVLSLIEWAAFGYVAHRCVHLFRRKKRVGKRGWLLLAMLALSSASVYTFMMDYFQVRHLGILFVAHAVAYFFFGTLVASLKVKYTVVQSFVRWDPSYQRHTWQRVFQALPGVTLGFAILILSGFMRFQIWADWIESPSSEAVFMMALFFVFGVLNARFWLWEAWWHEKSRRKLVWLSLFGFLSLFFAVSEFLKVNFGLKDFSFIVVALEIFSFALSYTLYVLGLWASQGRLIKPTKRPSYTKLPVSACSDEEGHAHPHHH